ncbi:hypothetical protein E3U55_06535 [Filobacillus milosensis]|uniref:Uncharacterized protein n=1 Tax=Filobacillus milosensis TaxID=94137 RepID=A0A4Y8ISA9_9BACI|nr:hypothetical protein [Filobacillus milosensis]TFB22892.1 hypothetical protein E3U55_06535 [Filobacillus milosensis]
MKKLWMIILITVVLTACGTASGNSMPEAMPEDFNFSVKFGVSSKNQVNTYTDTITKDLIANGTATADLTLTDEEMQDIYKKMREINIMEEKDLIPDTNCGQEPHTDDSWKITIKGETITHEWTESYCELTDDARKLYDLRQEIWQLVRSKDEYKQLPKAEGGYS